MTRPRDFSWFANVIERDKVTMILKKCAYPIFNLLAKNQQR